ncbi:MAG: segregation/condensation protein A, partial [Gammaproteobacteria bacterium]|nr:segregation/condensation protein A [Gammaproteobacteria bacterium]
MNETSEKPSNVVDLDAVRGVNLNAADASTTLRERDLVSVPKLVELRQGAAQQELPLALVQGEPLHEMPQDLYIPPAALEVFLEAFEGPLDLLLYLIKRHNLDILEIDVALLTEQYMQYVRLMDTMQFELAAEYLVMAATLTEIKSRMLLPRASEIDEDDEDPRLQLIKRLQEYERYKQAAVDIDDIPRLERDIFVADVAPPQDDRPIPQPDIDLKELLVALGDVLHRA